MLAQENDNTIAKYRQKICVLISHEQMFVSNESVRIQTQCKNI